MNFKMEAFESQIYSRIIGKQLIILHYHLFEYFSTSFVEVILARAS